MPITLDTDDPNLRATLNKIGEFENLNAGAYDKVILTLAGAALALSLTFTHDLVPVAVARNQWALLSAWGGFVLTLGINVGGYILSLMNARAQIRLAYAVWRDKKQEPAALMERANRDEWRLYRLNVAQGIAFLISMALLAFYVGDNTLHTPGARAVAPATQQQTETPAKPSAPSMNPKTPPAVGTPATAPTAAAPPRPKAQHSARADDGNPTRRVVTSIELAAVATDPSLRPERRIA
jgi:hypothetical protein